MTDPSSEQTPENTTKAVPGAPAPDGILFDLTLLLAAGNGDTDFTRKLVALFIESVPQAVAELKSAAAQKEYKLVRRIAHKIRSSIDLLGIHSLNEPVKKLENIVEKDKEIDQYLTTLDTTIQKVIVQLRESF